MTQGDELYAAVLQLIAELHESLEILEAGVDGLAQLHGLEPLPVDGDVEGGEYEQ